MNIFNWLISKRDKKEKTNKLEPVHTRTYPSIEMLVCKENDTLTVVKTTYKHNDLYFIKDGQLLSIIDEIYDRHNTSVDNSFEYCNHAIKPVSYFNIAKLLDLKVDKLSFIYVVCMWCDNNDCWVHDCGEQLSPLEFYKARPDYFPKFLPSGWENIYIEADEFYQQVFNVRIDGDN